MDRRDGCPDALVLPEAATLDQRPWDAGHQDQCEWDASGDARPGVKADARLLDLPDGSAGKSADPEPDGLERDG